MAVFENKRRNDRGNRSYLAAGRAVATFALANGFRLLDWSDRERVNMWFNASGGMAPVATSRLPPRPLYQDAFLLLPKLSRGIAAEKEVEQRRLIALPTDNAVQVAQTSMKAHRSVGSAGNLVRKKREQKK
jgi:hypothetical protein